MENENPSYFAIIPADVRYDKRLKANEKLMYGEITCLANKLGYCFSTNNYFAELYDVTPQAISGWIKNLEKCGYITCEYLHNGTEIKERRIRIVKDTNSTNDEEGNSTKVEKGINKSLKGYKQKFKDNNTSSNNTSNNNTSKAKKPKGQHKEIYTHYFENYTKLFEQGKLRTDKASVNYDVTGTLIKNLLLQAFTLEEIILILDRAMADDWIVGQGYSLNVILSAGQVNKLLNAKPQTKAVQTKEQYTDEEYMKSANFEMGVY